MSGFVVFGGWTADGEERDAGRKEKGERVGWRQGKRGC